MALNFEKFNGLIPAIVQDHKTGKILMLGFMNEEAYDITVREKKATFYSRSRESIWTKGETSGNYLYVKDIIEDCDHDTLLIKADPAGPVCHTGADTCFNEINQETEFFISHLVKVIHDRHEHPSETSYTSSLFRQGINKIAQKVGEEAVELVIESKDDNKDLFLNEAADLFFHYLVLLEAKGYSFDEIIAVLKERHK
ncbi:MAG: bifunctional phosphoribosyl-AMP cyclohydrolase/phosphoribosyl-ATP diphosphatase HisIE [Cyclobacteriaceae bacterium]|nr:bifunctional phosphoribosyl-AMP cyclohydrolase/phosphoribosyl-ATP diphosphatase HisIE [Cyclobacteriaceae bacterium]